MKIKTSLTRSILVGTVLVAALLVTTTPAAARTKSEESVQFTCTEAQDAVNFLLSADEQLEALDAANPTNTFLTQESPIFDQYISDAIQYVESHTAGTCTFKTEDE